MKALLITFVLTGNRIFKVIISQIFIFIADWNITQKNIHWEHNESNNNNLMGLLNVLICFFPVNNNNKKNGNLVIFSFRQNKQEEETNITLSVLT